MDSGIYFLFDADLIYSKWENYALCLLSLMSSSTLHIGGMLIANGLLFALYQFWQRFLGGASRIFGSLPSYLVAGTILATIFMWYIC